MSLKHGSLEALLAPDDGSLWTLPAAAPLPHLNPVVWIPFSGDSVESVTSFIRSVQRVAFQHNRIKDDEWIAELASTCFKDTALLWYLGLKKETQSSWAKLRIALVQRYSVQGIAQTPEPFGTVSLQPKLSPITPKLADIGIIEVLLPHFGDVLGYLSQDPTGKFVVDSDAEKALKLEKVPHPDSGQFFKKIYGLRLQETSEPRFPFLGLKLVKFPGEDPNIVPQWEPNQGYWSPIQDVPDCCNIPSASWGSWWGSSQKTTSHATWDFVQATKSDYEQYYIRKAGGPDPETRVVSAVWTLSDPVNGMARLGLTWPDGNDTNETTSEIQLEAFLPKDKLTGLHVHSRAFAKRGDAPSFRYYESHVVLVFKPVSST